MSGPKVRFIDEDQVVPLLRWAHKHSFRVWRIVIKALQLLRDEQRNHKCDGQCAAQRVESTDGRDG